MSTSKKKILLFAMASLWISMDRAKDMVPDFNKYNKQSGKRRTKKEWEK